MMMKRYVLVGVFCFCAAVVQSAYAADTTHRHAEKAVYTCPMHPQYLSDKPGNCPICGMNLILKDDGSPAPAASGEKTSGVVINADKQQSIGVTKDVVKKRMLSLDVPAQGSVTLGGSRIVLKVYESDMGSVKYGQPVTFEALAFPGKTFRGTVVTNVATEVYEIDAQSRTVNVAVRVDTPVSESKLKKGMSVYAHIAVDLGEKISVPVTAVMDTGVRKIVYLVKDDTFVQREVTLGRKAGEFYELVSGLSEDDAIVTSGNFLVDAESKLKGSM